MERIRHLYESWIAGTATDSEVLELYDLMKAPGSFDSLAPAMKAVWNSEKNAFELPDDEQLHHVAARILEGYPPEKEVVSPGRVRFMSKSWLRYAVAVLIVFGTAAYFFLQQRSPKTVSEKPVAHADVAPPAYGQAVLTLASGRNLYLNDSSNGSIATQQGLQISHGDNGEIVYEATGSAAAAAIEYNTLSVPKGGRIATIILADGTRVYLNSESSLKYPVQFSGRERTVELQGEAYFEVAADALRKFKVITGETSTEVLGTSFNIKSYPEEGASFITLLTGGIKVSEGAKSALPKAGEQCVCDSVAGWKIKPVNTEEVVAWKNGYFQFESATLKTIAQEVSRWYNVHFVFENKEVENETFHAKFSRNSKLSELFKVLEYSDVKFEIIKNNEVIIK